MEGVNSQKIYGVSSEDKKKLETIFNVSQPVVSYALTGTRDNEKSKKIRYTALTQMGGFIKPLPKKHQNKDSHYTSV